MIGRLFGGLRERVLLLVVVCLIPALGLIVYSYSQERQAAEGKLKEEALRLVQLVAGEHGRLIMEARHLLIALSQLPQVQSKDSAACDALFGKLLSRYPHYANLAAADINGRIFCSATPHLDPVTISDRSYFKRAVETRDFAASDSLIGRATTKRSLVFAYPFLDGKNNVDGVALAAVDLDWFSRLASRAQLPSGSVLTVRDPSGTILARFPEPEKWVGRVAGDAPVLKAMIDRSEGVDRLEGADRVKRLYAFTLLRHAGESGIFLSVGIPLDVAYSKVDRLLLRNLGALFLVGVITLLAAWKGSDLLVLRRVDALLDTARRLGSGDLGVRTGLTYRIGELGRLAHAFDEMAEALEKRDERLRESEAEYRMLVEHIPTITHIAAFDPAGAVLYVSPQVENLLGHSPEEYKADPDLWCRGLHPEDRERVLSEAIRAYESQDTFASVYRMYTRGGDLVWFRHEAVVVRDEAGAPLYFHGVMLDVTRHKETDQALHRSEARYRAIVEDQTDLIRRFTPDGLLTFVNDAYCRYYGETREQLDGSSFWRHVLPEDREGLSEQLAALSVTGSAAAIEYRSPMSEGEVAWQSWTNRAIRDESGRVLEWQSVGRDITDRKLAEHALHRLNRTLRTLIKCNEVLVRAQEELDLLRSICRAIVEEGGYALAWVSLAGQEKENGTRPVAWAGSEAEAPGGASFFRGGKGKWHDAAEAAIRTARPSIINTICDTPDGGGPGEEAAGKSVFSLIALPLTDKGEAFGALSLCASGQSAFDAGERQLLTGLAADLAYGIVALRTREERNQAAIVLLKREEYFRSLLFNMHEDILVVDNELKVREVNKSWLSTIGWGRDKVLGRPFQNLWFTDMEENADVEGLLREVLEKGQPRRARIGHLRPDGTRAWLDLLLSPMKGETGETTHVIQAIRDVTPEFELEARLRQAQKLEAIGTLAGGIAHDFNNILGLILGHTELALFDVPASTQVRENLDHAIHGCHRAKDLVKQILAFSRQSDQERRPLGVGVIVKEVAKLLTAALPSTVEIRVKIDAGERCDVVMADPTQIHQVLMNLCTNAAHAMRESGGLLEVSLSQAEYSEGDGSRPPDVAPGAYVRLSVRDTGHGFDEATGERIFEPYFTTKGPGEGSGLGLAVVHGIVKSHGGVILFSSEVGKGTVFDVFLAKIEAEPVAEAGPSSRGIAMGKERILIVDDEEGLANTLKKMLDLLGYKTTAKTSSIEALEALRSQPHAFDLLITDQTMPKMSGIELSKEALSLRPDLPIILCTGFSDSATPEKAKSVGIREYIMKPWIIRDVARAIRKLLGEESGGKP